MRLDHNRFAASLALAAAVVWALCSLLVATIPALLLPITGHMLHAELTGFEWHLTWPGFLIGLVSWVIWAGIAGWLIAWIYNSLTRQNAGR